MEKERITMKEAKQKFNNSLIRVGYCHLQSLLANLQPFAYSVNSFGWACDYYHLGSIVISTGYTPVGQQLPYEMVARYESQARESLANGEYDQIDLLLHEFVEEVEDYLK